MVDFMEEIKYYYVRCEWCKNIEPFILNDESEMDKTYALNELFARCDNCKKMTLQRIIGYDI